MKRRLTERGFPLWEFKDHNGTQCSLQESSLATAHAIWLGCDDANPRVLVRGKGWIPVEVPEGTIFNTRMYLTRRQVKRLLPRLISFAMYGEI